MKTTTTQRSFGGANIKGTPPMPAAFVRSDLRKLRRRLDIIALQEFRHRWYWTVLVALFGRWSSFPSPARALREPVYGGQGLLWKRSVVRRAASLVVPAFDFSLDNSGIMENRWIRAVLLEDCRTLLQCWYVSTHFVVGGDQAGDGARRQQFLRQNLHALDKVLTRCRRSGEPVVLELDANIHYGTWAYAALMAVVEKHHGRVVGAKGVEYLVVFDGLHTRVVVDDAYVISPKAAGLHTDHEVRCIDHHLESTRSPV